MTFCLYDLIAYLGYSYCSLLVLIHQLLKIIILNMYDNVTIANDTTKYAFHISRTKSNFPVYAGKMGILRVKRDSPIYQKIMMSTTTKCHALLCFGVFGRYTTNCYPSAQNVSATNSGTLILTYCPGFLYISFNLNGQLTHTEETHPWPRLTTDNNDVVVSGQSGPDHR